ncbi:MAG: UDP-N-acetylmuramate dehydrogenase, partial [Longimicrobiales bacterium]
RLDVEAVVRGIEARGVEASALADVPAIVDLVANRALAGDLVLVMSNGAFGGLIPMLLEALGGRKGE